MEKDHEKTNTVVDSYRFGSIAYMRKHVTVEQIQQALAEQVEDNTSGKPHRRLGTIFRDKGWITEEQEKSILDEMGWSG